MTRLRVWLQRLLVLLVILFSVDAFLVVFFRGVRLELWGLVVRSTTIEFPVVAFLITLGLLLLVQGKWKETCLLMASLCVAAGLGEAMLHVIDHPWSKPILKTWLEPVEVFGFQLPRNFEGRGIVDEYIKTNSQGLRDVEHEWHKPEGTFRILGLGDSFTFGWGVKLEESFLKILETRLSEELGQPVESINAGVPGYGLNHYYVYLKNVGLRYDPDVIVVAYFADDLPSSFKEELAPYNEDFPERLQHKGGMLAHSRFYNFITSAAAVIRVRTHGKQVDHMRNMEVRRAAWGRYDYPVIDNDKAKAAAKIALLDEYLSRFQALGAQRNARLVMMFIPDISHLYHPEYQNINRVLTQLTRKHGIPFVDMTPIFESSSDLATYYLFPKDAHTNANGHKAMASALNVLICEGALPPGSCRVRRQADPAHSSTSRQSTTAN